MICDDAAALVGSGRALSAEKMASTVAELGDAMRGLSDHPQAEETKAAWTILETEMVNMLGLVINDPDSESEITTAANNYKTAVQKACVHGRAARECEWISTSQAD